MRCYKLQLSPTFGVCGSNIEQHYGHPEHCQPAAISATDRGCAVKVGDHVCPIQYLLCKMFNKFPE